MTIEEKYLKRIDDLLALHKKVDEAWKPNSGHHPDDAVNYRQLLASSEQFIQDVYKVESAYYRNYMILKKLNNNYELIPGIKGLLIGIKDSIENGYITTMKNEVLAEFSGDYLEMATHLNTREALHIAAAVIAGTVLEERVRQLARFHLTTDLNAKGEPDSVENLNMKLRPFYADKLNDERLVRTQYGIRTDAAHGEWNADRENPRIKADHISQVNVMITNVTDFIRRNPI